MTIWYETELIEELNDFVDKWFSKPLEKEWYSIGGIHYRDFKNEASKWIEDNVALLQDLQEMIDDLPDDEVEEYEDTLSQTVTEEKI